MTLFDVNMLVYAHRADADHHRQYDEWLTERLNSPGSFAVSSIILSGFVRVVSHPRVFTIPSPLDLVLNFCNAIRERDNAVAIHPGPRHWQIFTDLCIKAKAKGNPVPDCYLAALAMENDCTFVTADQDYCRFKDLKLEILTF